MTGATGCGRAQVRICGVLLSASLLLCAAAPGIAAEKYPDRVIKIVQPFPAGGSTDVLARGLAQKLSEALGQPVIVESHPAPTASSARRVSPARPPTATPCC